MSNAFGAAKPKTPSLVRTLGSKLLEQANRRLGTEIWVVGARRLTRGFEIPAEHRERFSFRPLSFAEAQTAAANAALCLDPGFVDRAFALGELCFGAFDGDAVVAYTWRSRTVAPLNDGMWLRIRDAAYVYGYKSFVLPAYRGMRLIRSLEQSHDEALIALGFGWDIGYVALQNSSSIAAHFKHAVDRRRLGYAGYVSIGSRTFPFCTGAARDVLVLATSRERRLAPRIDQRQTLRSLFGIQ